MKWKLIFLDCISSASLLKQSATYCKTMKKQIGAKENNSFEKMVSGFFYCKKILKELGFEITGGYCDPTQFHAVVELSAAKLRIDFITSGIFNLQEKGYADKKVDGDFYIFCIPEPKNHRFWILTRKEMEEEMNILLVQHYIITGTKKEKSTYDLDLKTVLINKYSEKWQKIR